MAKRRMIAYFMHENEHGAAEQAMTATTSTDSFVIGDLDDNDVPALEAQGLVVTPVEQPAAVALPPTRRAGAPARAAAESVEPGFAPAGPAAQALPRPLDFYIVVLSGPLLERWRQALAALGVTLIDRMRGGGYKAQLTFDQVGQVRAQPFVVSVDWIEPTPPMVLRTPSAVATPGASPQKKFDIRLNLAIDLPSVLLKVQATGLTVLGSSGRKIRVQCAENDLRLGTISAMPEVDTVAEYVEPVLCNDLACQVLGVLTSAGTPVAYLGDGAGQTVGIADTGIDDTHPDFAGRLKKLIARGRPGKTDDPNGHGTHVAGSFVGDGNASAGQFRGIAPKADLVFQSLLDSSGQLGGLPLDLNDLYDEAYAAEVKIHNNSWGAGTPSTYVINSEEVDEAVGKHRDLLLVFAAGNNGSGTNLQHAATGFVDWLSISSPGTAKNVLTVGASRSSRTDGPFKTQTYGQKWPGQFPDNPIAGDVISGDPDSIAAFSGRGPCDDRRIKPDVVAPGTEVCSTMSALAPAANFEGVHATHPQYAFDSGTSMAAPLVSGCAALVRQYFCAPPRNHQPSAALLKATLINGTKWLSGVSATAAAIGTPNFHQGHGGVNLATTIPDPANPTFALQFVDDWQDPTKSFTKSGDRRRFAFTLPSSAPELRICLAYTDLPARGLQNNLNLLLQDPSGKKWLGNSQLPKELVLTVPDPDNNVETIKLPNAAAGSYLIQVFAGNLLHGPQDFALVVTAAGLPVLTEI